MDNIFGRKTSDGSQQNTSQDNYYAELAKHIDPSVPGLLNAPQLANAAIAAQATDNDDTIRDFRDGLRGYRELKRMNPMTGMEDVLIERFGEPAMNEEGINELVAELRMYLSKTYILSAIPKEDKRRIDAMTRIVWKSLNVKLIVNAQKYELDKTRRPTIVHTMVFIIISNVYRGFGETPEVGKYYGSNKRVETYNSNAPQAQPVKKGWFGI